ncbi:hypothetical protein BO86DRAFT_46048 [Aspergillus japonicus CBS 114.51]|uniref:Uncharacterized protein n=1 Tax=Aspergillus japonicus CBS 114.51 TaxID=1448312 RepID=A0A8T8WJ54_ASPJA|nr:hypothetical protein BO86DRAFT_46048 [Aspergillus japonicus CBS 114.51]RAH75838.1 hypothetical protein BO86DRAFT_46048 [Aspergillus japonicus CBS 114.51]
MDPFFSIASPLLVLLPSHLFSCSHLPDALLFSFPPLMVRLILALPPPETICLVRIQGKPDIYENGNYHDGKPR